MCGGGCVCVCVWGVWGCVWADVGVWGVYVYILELLMIVQMCEKERNLLTIALTPHLSQLTKIYQTKAPQKWEMKIVNDQFSAFKAPESFSFLFTGDCCSPLFFFGSL